MNKKFSTLVASLLFASAFSAYAGTAAPMFAAPTTVEVSTRATVKAVEADLSALDGWDATATVEGQLLSAITNNSRLFVIQNSTATVADANGFLTYATAFKGAGYGTPADVAAAAPFYWSITPDGQVKNNVGNVLNVGGFSNFEVVPVKDNSNTASLNGYFFALVVKDGANFKYVNYDGTAFSLDAGATDYTTNIATAALFSPVETAFTTAAKGEDLNKELKDGFSVAVTYGNNTLTGAELFAGKVTAVKAATAFPAVGTDQSYALKKGDKYLVFDETMNSTNAVKGGFKLVDATAAEKLISDGKTANLTFVIKVADNGTKAVEVTVASGQRLYVNVSNGTNVLTALDPANLGTNAANWAATALGAENILDFKTLLTGQFVKVNYIKTGEEDQTNTYKINGVLGLRYNGTAVEDDFVKAADFVAEDPSTMWAPSIDGDDLVLTNRENKNITVTVDELRVVNGGYEATSAAGNGIAAGDLIKITPVASVTKTDGYQVYADNVLINSTFYLGQSRRNADGDVPAYWAENHGTHQIGATVNQDEATKWNVQLVKKGTSSLIDSVLVVSDLYAYNATTGVTTEIADTLAVLPYVFQNRDNREFVKLNGETNLEYYICDKDNKEAKDNGAAQVFALKKRPGNTYNYVTLNRQNTAADKDVTVVTSIDGANKVYLKNSANKGTWENVETYSDDANSLMVVDPINAPEYRKVKKDWGDVVKIFREEYPTEVLFEKRDVKSVVDNDTLSFLNVNNSVIGANPALFVDTAYVNRTVNGVDNTCYQYLLAVNVDKENSVYCPYNPEHNTDAWREENGGPCADAKENPAVVKGRFLINLVDTAFAYKQDHLHNNPYINMVEADENLAKLSFVEGVHIKDTLFITRKGGEVVKLQMNDPNFNVAKFAFRYVDNEAGSFKIQTQYKEYDSEDLEAFEKSADNEGYLRWVNGTVVVTNKYTNGETFNMEENFEGNPTANEDVTVSSISVVATNGAVIIKGAAGKKVSISNVLGQTVASTVVSSDNATISAPAGVVIVAVEGEAAVKAIVK
ncbi:DUF6383 domain-containing protein [Parabacteroides gordonii]|jgi:hypothetical protein|uniref:DUF6383 domain-containing protein n=1 Tax=Parabacteroides gordonii TaxID=574930 RepID=UPI0024201E04|nr:DUF6383 domain-containing protein [Parabacteroides gordonii]